MLVACNFIVYLQRRGTRPHDYRTKYRKKVLLCFGAFYFDGDVGIHSGPRQCPEFLKDTMFRDERMPFAETLGSSATLLSGYDWVSAKIPTS